LRGYGIVVDSRAGHKSRTFIEVFKVGAILLILMMTDPAFIFIEILPPGRPLISKYLVTVKPVRALEPVHLAFRGRANFRTMRRSLG
jgi:hypothetical protein